jgi:hypothetical protein
MKSDKTEEKQKPAHLYKPGQSGNLNGRPKGARSKFGEDFVIEFAEHWAKNGKSVLDTLVKEEPAAYAKVACTLLPKVIEFDEDTRDILAIIAGVQIPFEKIREKLKPKTNGQASP